MAPLTKTRGRPPKAGSVSHGRRLRFARGSRLRVKLRLALGRQTMRKARMKRLVGECVDAANGRFATKLLACWGAGTEIVLVVETKDCETLASAMQGLAVRIAKRVNCAYGTKGRVFGQRYAAIVIVRVKRMSRGERLLRTVNYHLINLSDFLWFLGADKEEAMERARTGPPIRMFIELMVDVTLPRVPGMRFRTQRTSSIRRREREMMQRFRDSLPMKRCRRRLAD